MPGPARVGRMDEIRPRPCRSHHQRSQAMSQLTKAFWVNKTGFSPAGCAAVGVVPEPELSAVSEPVGATGVLSAPMRTVAQRVEGEPP